VKIEKWPEIRDGKWLLDYLGNKRSFLYWTNVFNSVFHEQINTWDYQWVFACWMQNTLTIIPNVNLVSNIGFGINSTHTRETNIFAEMNIEPVDFPLLHPSLIIRDSIADDFTEKNNFSGKSFIIRLSESFNNISRKISP
jgi:hypothetical protein